MRHLHLLVIVALLVVASGIVIVFSGTILTLLQVQPHQRANDAGATVEGISSAGDASNRFALSLYSRLKNENQGKNMFFSPYSISTALAMTYEGAKGQTADEMQSVFHFPANSSVRLSSYAAIYNQLNPANAQYQLSTANAIWIQSGFTILNDYANTVKEFYAGEANNVDFVGNTEQARQTINNWVADQTNNKIKDLFPQGTLGPSNRLVLTNAIYFKGDWKDQFDRTLTTDQDFRVDDQTTVKVPMMQRTGHDSKYYYFETDDAQILEMPYKGDRLSMLVLLPKNESLDSLESSLTLENLNSWRKTGSFSEVDLYIPKFTFTSKYLLNDDLQEMGMPSAFNPDVADFSGIDGKKDLSIQIVVHQAYVSVDEKGTEAAAATGVGMVGAAYTPHVVFRADHPFIFIIQDKMTGNILFLGRVVDPTSE